MTNIVTNDMALHLTQLIAKKRLPKRAVAHVNKVKGTQCKHPVKDTLRMGAGMNLG